MEKESEAYKTIGEVAKIVGLINKKKKELYLLIQLGFGKRNFDKLNQKFYLVKEGIIAIRKFI